jgi:hypothetical protein
MTKPPYTPGEWHVQYSQAQAVFWIGTAAQPKLLELPARDDDEHRANLHLLAAAPQLYEALLELLLSHEEALMQSGDGCESERCEAARQQAYQALGVAEGRVRLKEGEPGTY